MQPMASLIEKARASVRRLHRGYPPLCHHSSSRHTPSPLISSAITPHHATLQRGAFSAQASPTDCFLLQRGSAAACWYGAHSPAEAPAAAQLHVERLRRFHRLPAEAPVSVEQQACESAHFWELLGQAPSPTSSAVPRAPPAAPASTAQGAAPGWRSNGVPDTPARGKRRGGGFGKAVAPSGVGTVAEAAGGGEGSGLLGVQMGTAALQTVVSELLLALHTISEQPGAAGGGDDDAYDLTPMEVRRDDHVTATTLRP